MIAIRSSISDTVISRLATIKLLLCVVLTQINGIVSVLKGIAQMKAELDAVKTEDWAWRLLLGFFCFCFFNKKKENEEEVDKIENTLIQ